MDAIIQELGKGAKKKLIVNFFQQRGFKEPNKAYFSVKYLLELPNCQSSDKKNPLFLLENLFQRGNPEELLREVHHLFEEVQDPWGKFPPKDFHSLLDFLNTGPYPRSLLKKYPGWWSFVTEPSLRKKVSSLRDYQNRFQEFDPNKKLSFLEKIRRFHDKEIFRIGFQEMEGILSISETSLQLSLLAETIAIETLQYSFNEIQEKWGKVEKNNQGFFILAMGKLGGRELNISSDIDVVPFYQTDECRIISLNGDPSELTPHEYYTRLMEHWIKSLSQVTSEGFAYRVDLRLRPEGTRGPLVNSLRSAETYYETWGSLWERAAFLKARPIAGNISLGKQFLRSLEPFIYQKHIDFRVLEEIKTLKEKISQEQIKRNQIRSPKSPDYDLKLDEGGIREIEFFVQALQLIHGGREFLLRSSNTLTTLENIKKLRLIKTKDAETLIESYSFFRRLEHLLQFHGNQQTHLYPQKPRRQEKLTQLLKLSSNQNLNNKIVSLRKSVHEIFLNLLSEGKATHSQKPKISLPSQQMPEILALLHEYSGTEEVKHKVLLENTAERISKKLQRIPDWRKYLKPLEALFRQIGTKRDYYSLINNHPQILDQLFFIFSQSEFLSELLLKNFSLIGRLHLKTSPMEKENWELELKNQMNKASDRGEAMDILRRFHHQGIFQIGQADLSDFHSLPENQQQLTYLAECCLKQAAHWVFKELQEKYGVATLEGTSTPASLAIIGLGTLGATELTYTSDLDIIFLYNGAGETKGSKKISNQEFFTLFAQRLISFLSTATALGTVYHVDTRLRPSGRAGTLVTSHQAFLNYHQKQGQLWEVQSLLRSRIIFCDESFEKLLENEIRKILFQKRTPQKIKKEIHAMRVRVQKERTDLSSHNPLEIDLKLGEGGLMDIEFITQFLQLSSFNNPSTAWMPNTLQALLAHQENNRISEANCQILTDAYKQFRQLFNRLCLVCNQTIERIHPGLPRLDEIARTLAFNEAKTLIEHLGETAQKVRTIYLEFMTEDSA